MIPSSGLSYMVLGSSSSGNCTAVTDGTTMVLVDAGLPLGYISENLDRSFRDLSVSGVFVSHEHSDHIRSVIPLSRRYGCPIYASKPVMWVIDPKGVLKAVHIAGGETLSVGSMKVTPVPVSHDAIEPFGFLIEGGGRKLGIATDLGCFDEEFLQKFSDLDYLVIESNYDPDMLKRGPYPRDLKFRIEDRAGHLSNNQCGELLCRIAGPRLKQVVLAHLSEENNDPLLAIETNLSAICELETRPELWVSYPRTPTPLYGDPLRPP